VIVNLYPCENIYYYVCGSAFYQFQLITGVINYIIHAVISTILITMSSMILLFRVTYENRVRPTGAVQTRQQHILPRRQYDEYYINFNKKKISSD
jgi:hypothetical protein